MCILLQNSVHHYQRVFVYRTSPDFPQHYTLTAAVRYRHIVALKPIVLLPGLDHPRPLAGLFCKKLGQCPTAAVFNQQVYIVSKTVVDHARSTCYDIQAGQREMRGSGLPESSRQLILPDMLKARHHYKQVLQSRVLQEELGNP